MAAGQDQLAPVCVGNPDASVRAFNPLASGSYEDVLCSVILDDGRSIGHASEALVSGSERIGQVQQKWSPFGLGCSLFVLGAGILMNHLACHYPTAEHPEACSNLLEGGMGALGIACNFI